LGENRRKVEERTDGVNKMSKKSRMFSFITGCENPLGGKCPYGCVYCWAQGEKGLVNKYEMKKYTGNARLVPHILKKRFSEGDFIFVVDMRDMFSPDVPDDMLLEIFDWIRKNDEARFLFLTKNPRRYIKVIESGWDFPSNVVLGATIESNRDFLDISKAPPQSDRLYWMYKLSKMENVKNDLFISIEPILEFDFQEFYEVLRKINPWKIAVGYDNYGYKLPEPSLDTTIRFIEELEGFTDVEVKSLRRAWWAE